MLAKNNEYLQEAVSGVRQLTAEEQIRQQCQAREDYLYWDRIKAAETKRLKQQVNEQQSTIEAQQSTINEQQSTIDKQNMRIAELEAKLQQSGK